jgi:hypothetical protein
MNLLPVGQQNYHSHPKISPLLIQFYKASPVYITGYLQCLIFIFPFFFLDPDSLETNCRFVSLATGTLNKDALTRASNSNTIRVQAHSLLISNK